jgi:hypothetical protein
MIEALLLLVVLLAAGDITALWLLLGPGALS